MVLTIVSTPTVNMYPPPREDRLREAPSAKNAQGLFTPDACLFVGNLSTKVSSDTLALDLKALFSQFGPCHVKIKLDKKKGLPGAFVQFENVEHAYAALQWEDCTLHDRPLRLELAKGRRTAILGLSSGESITPEDVTFALENRGYLVSSSIEPYDMRSQYSPLVCRVTFAYVDDCRDAVKDFQKSDKYFMELVDLDGSSIGMSRGRYPSRGKPSYHASARNGNVQPRFGNSRPRRNGINGPRGGFRGFPKYQNLPFHPDNLPPPNGFPIPPAMISGIPYSENTPPFFPPPPAFPGPGYGNGPLIVHSQPRFVNPPMPPPMYLPPVSNGPLIVSSQPAYAPPIPTYWEPYPQLNGFIGTPSSISSQSNGYFGQACMAPPQPYQASGVDRASSSGSSNSKKVTITAPKAEPAKNEEEKSAGVEKKTGSGEETKTGEDFDTVKVSESELESGEYTDSGEDSDTVKLMNRKTTEKAPQLVPVNNSDSEDSEEKPHTPEPQEPFLPSSVIGLTQAAGIKDKVENGVKNADHGSDLNNGENGDDDDDDATIKENCTKTPDRSPSCSNPSTPPLVNKNDEQALPSTTQPRPRFTVEEHVRREAERLGSGLGEKALKEVMEELQAEMKEKREKQKTPMSAHPLHSESSSFPSLSTSLSRSSSKSA